MVRCTGTPISLDSWQVIPPILQPGDQSLRQRHFSIIDNSVILLDPVGRQPYGAGLFMLVVFWPTRVTEDAHGLAFLSHPKRNVPFPRIIPLVGIPTAIPGDRDWKFMCPLRRSLEQVLLLDPASLLFVSRPAIGCHQPRRDIRRFGRASGRILDLELKYGPLDEKPTEMSSTDFALLSSERQNLYLEWMLADSSLPTTILDDYGLRDVLATSKEHSTKQRHKSGRACA